MFAVILCNSNMLSKFLQPQQSYKYGGSIEYCWILSELVPCGALKKFLSFHRASCRFSNVHL